MLPWFQEAQHRNPDALKHFTDCDSCKREKPLVVRQSLGCGWEKPDPRIPVRPWDHPGRDEAKGERDDSGKLHLPVCVGYVCTLSEVTEASWAHEYWKNGELGQFCEGQATSVLRDAISIYAVEQSKARAWSTKNPEQK